MQKINKHLIRFFVLFVIIIIGFLYVYFSSFRPYQMNEIKTMQHMGKYVQQIGKSCILNNYIIQMEDSTYQKIHARKNGYFSLDHEKVYQLKDR